MERLNSKTDDSTAIKSLQLLDFDNNPDLPRSERINVGRSTHSRRPSSCPVCGKTFTRTDGMKRHLKNFHPDNFTTSGKCVCLECGKRVHTISHLRQHLEQEHGFVFLFERNDHINEQAFVEWKRKYEILNNCSFTKKTGKHTNSEKQTVVYYQCNRSGVYTSSQTTENRKRKLKTNGTCKLGTNCTCTMKATIQQDGSIVSETCGGHYGHSLELKHTWLSKVSHSTGTKK